MHTELVMYDKILPALAKLEEEKKFAKRISAPKAFFVSLDDGIIVMENLKKQDYFMIHRKDGKIIQKIF